MDADEEIVVVVVIAVTLHPVTALVDVSHTVVVVVSSEAETIDLEQVT